MKYLLPLITSLLLLTSCRPKAHAFMGTMPDGTPDILVYELGVIELLPFLFFSCCMGIMLLQVAIPGLRRLYTACFRFILKLVGKKRLQEESARMLATCVAWLTFTCGLCLYPLVLALYEDTFYPMFAGPMNLGYALVGAFFSAVLMLAAFIIASLSLIFCWQRLHAVEKTNPIATMISKRGTLPLLLLLLLTLPACKPTVKSLRHITIENWSFVHRKDCDLNAEARACVEHYLQTGEVNYATPENGITLLHLAAMTHRLWLVEQLLAEGADPNVRLMLSEENAPGDTPAILAVRAGGHMSNDDALLIIKSLMAAGADISIPGHGGSSILSACENSSYGEDDGEQLALELIKLGVKGNAKAAGRFVCSEWVNALGKLMDSPEREAICESMPELLHLAAFLFSGKEEELACASLLLEHADDVNARHDKSATPLCELFRDAGRKRLDDDELQRYADFALMLLEKGADPYLPEGEFGHSCAADLLQQSPALAGALAEQGYTILPPPHQFMRETLVEQLSDIPTAAVETTEARQQFDTLATLFTAPTEAMLAHGINYRKACSGALTLLNRADAARAEALLAQHPAWSDTSAWEGEAHAARGLLLAMQQNPAVTLPKELLLTAARSMEAAGKPAAARAITLLLSRDGTANDLIVQLCEDNTTPLPIRAAAWSCRLTQAGLPRLGEVREWLKDRDSHGLSKCRLARLAEYSAFRFVHPDHTEKPERLFYEKSEKYCEFADENEDRDVQHALLAVGAPLSAHHCGAGAPAELPAEIADYQARHGITTAASLELEIALARYILRHEELFREPVKENEETEEPEALEYVCE